MLQHVWILKNILSEKIIDEEFHDLIYMKCLEKANV